MGGACGSFGFLSDDAPVCSFSEIEEDKLKGKKRCVIHQHAATWNMAHLLTVVSKSRNGILEAPANRVTTLLCEFYRSSSAWSFYRSTSPQLKHSFSTQTKKCGSENVPPCRSTVPRALVPHHRGPRQPLSVLSGVMVSITISPMAGSSAST